MIAYLRNKAGAEVLKALIERPTTFLAMHVWNLGEVYYDFSVPMDSPPPRRHGPLWLFRFSCVAMLMMHSCRGRGH